MDKTRRTLLLAAISAPGSIGTVSNAVAQDQASVGAEFNQFSKDMKVQLEGLPSDRRDDILKFNGAVDIDDLLLTYVKRYPQLTPKQVLEANPKLKDVIAGNSAEREGEPSYERGPNHDKEPYDKIIGGHDRIGFSRT